MIRRFAALTIAVTLIPALAGAGGSSIEQRIQAERAKAEQTQAQLHQKRAELHAVTLHYNDLQNQLSETNAAIGTVNDRIGTLEGQQSSTQRRIDWNTVQLDAAKRSLQLHDSMLKRRLVDIYEYGDMSYVNALIAARSFSEFVERWEDLRLLIAANEHAVRARKRAEARVAAIQAALERTRLELEQEQQAQEEARNQLDTLASERQNLVALAATHRHSVQSEVAEIEGLSASEEAELESLIQAREREIEAQRRAAGIAGTQSEGGPGCLLLAGNWNDYLTLRLALQSVRRLPGVPSRPRHRGSDGNHRHRCGGRDGDHGAVVRRVRKLHFDRSRRQLLDRLRPPLGDLRRDGPVGSARPGDWCSGLDRSINRASSTF